jgi:hypothetical protein
MGCGCYLPRAGYVAFFEREIPEKHVPGGYLSQSKGGLIFNWISLANQLGAALKHIMAVNGSVLPGRSCIPYQMLSRSRSRTVDKAGKGDVNLCDLYEKHYYYSRFTRGGPFRWFCRSC